MCIRRKWDHGSKKNSKEGGLVGRRVGLLGYGAGVVDLQRGGGCVSCLRDSTRSSVISKSSSATATVDRGHQSQEYAVEVPVNDAAD